MMQPSAHERYLEIVKSIVLNNLDKEKYAVFLFGSRVERNSSRAADIDVGVLANFPLPNEKLFKIKDEIEESIVPFSVDIVDFFNAKEDFKKTALSRIQIWQKPKHISLDLKL